MTKSVNVLDLLKKMAAPSDEVKDVIASCEMGALSCEMIQIVEDERPHQLLAGAENIVFTSGSGLIIFGNTVERVGRDVYSFAPGVIYAVIPDGVLEGFLLLPSKRSIWERRYWKKCVPMANFDGKTYEAVLSLKEEVAIEYIKKVAGYHDPYMAISWKNLPSLSSMIEQLGLMYPPPIQL